MRSDRTRSAAFVAADSWKFQKYRDGLFVRLENGPPFFKSNSFSGHEPNNLYLNNGSAFQDMTLVSGADHDGDGRGFAILDFDKDGWQDIALVSTNSPRFILFRNQMGDALDNNRVELKLTGANAASEPDLKKSNRDGIGAKITATYQSGRRQIQQRQAGEGNVAQNGGSIWFGQPANDPIVSVDVVWPSGKTSRVDQPGADKPIEVQEPLSSDALSSGY